MGKDHAAIFAMPFRAQKSGEHPIAERPAEARSSHPVGCGRHRRIPERKQLNRDQAFIIASSLWPLLRKSVTTRPADWQQQAGHTKDALCHRSCDARAIRVAAGRVNK
jgi:hypothetical protein